MEELSLREKCIKRLAGMFIVTTWIFLSLCIIGTLTGLTVPFMPLPASEHNLIHNAPDGTLVGDWGHNCCRETYALFPDGKDMVRISNPFFWAFASHFRLNVESPFYSRQPDKTTCHIVFTRTSLLKPFEKSCKPERIPLRTSDMLDGAFADGRHSFLDAAQQAKAVYEKYRAFGLVQ